MCWEKETCCRTFSNTNPKDPLKQPRSLVANIKSFLGSHSKSTVLEKLLFNLPSPRQEKPHQFGPFQYKKDSPVVPKRLVCRRPHTFRQPLTRLRNNGLTVDIMCGVCQPWAWFHRPLQSTPSMQNRDKLQRQATAWDCEFACQNWLVRDSEWRQAAKSSFFQFTRLTPLVAS